MLHPRGEAPARRVPLHHSAVFTFANQHRCFLPEEEHQLDEHHCITQQQSPSPTNADACLSRRSTGSTSTTASPSSSNLCQPTPMLPPRGGAPARRAPLHHPAAVTIVVTLAASSSSSMASLHTPLPSISRARVWFAKPFCIADLSSNHFSNQCGTSAFSLVRCFTKEMVPHLEYEMLRSLVDLAH
jgi:hypothetical protein